MAIPPSLAWQPPRPRPESDSGSPLLSQAATEEKARARLAEFITAEPEQQVTVTPTVVHGEARQVLITQSTTAELLVLGSRGFGGFRGLLMGSVSHAVLRQAESPVAVIPTSQEAQ